MPPPVKDVAKMKNHYVIAMGQGIGLGAKQEAISKRMRLLEKADAIINHKWKALNGAPGQPITPDLSGLKEVGSGYYREYKDGIIYFLAPDLEKIHTPEQKALVLAVGKSVVSGSAPCWVHGAILERYKALGGPEGDLGWPTGDAKDGTEGGQIQTFSTHIIYWWPDTGAIEMSGSVVVTYTGLACFGETDDDQLSSKDEPYVIFGTIPPPPLPPFTVRTKIYDGVDGGDTREEQRIELYRGFALPLAVSSVVMEHDLEDPDKYKETVRKGVEKASEGAAAGIGAIPVVGPFLAPVAEAFLKAIGPDINDGPQQGVRILMTTVLVLGSFTITDKTNGDALPRPQRKL
jgi:Uncharacterized protein potentially involved in peptidoglycan biosynthesis